LLQVFDWAGVESVEAEELAVLPGLDELFALTEIESLCASGDHDVVVVDCGPTAETIRLLSLPDVIGWYMDRLFPASRRLHRVVAPVLSRVGRLPMADDAVFAAGQRLYDRLDAVHRILADPEVTSARLVVNPERMVVAEARRTFTQLSLFGYQVDAVIVNRVLPDDVADPWFDRWRATHAEHLDAVRADFAPVPVLQSRLAPTDVVGVEALRCVGEELWTDLDPATRLVDRRPVRLSRLGDDVELTVDLPFAGRSDVEVSRSGDELLITLGAQRRALALPESLRRREVSSATVSDGALRVRFAERARMGT
jgi:arsenite-transporting ATPase